MFRADINTAVAAAAALRVNHEIRRDRIHRTAADTKFTLDTFALVQHHIHQRIALEGAAGFLSDVFQIFMAVVAQSCQNGIGSGLSESAEGTGFDLPAEIFEQFDIAFFTVSGDDAFKDFEHAGGSHATEGAFAAAFAVGEIQEVAGGFDHAAVIADDDHTAGTHDGTQRTQ